MLSLVSYPTRGEGGKAFYRGNCAPQMIHDLIEQYHIQELSDYMCGSGTVEDVCAQRGIPSHCYDLNRGFDLLSMDIPERNQAIFWHPPYGDMIQYSDNMYSSADIERQYGFDPSTCDLSRIHDWDQFVKAMNYCCLKQFSSLEPGGRLAILMGDMRRRGRYYSMLCDIVKPGAVESIVIKAQHNCQSYGKRYANSNFTPIVHEYLLVLRREDGLCFPVAWTVKNQMDIRDSKCATWRDVLAAVMRTKQGHAMPLAEIYSMVEGHRRCDGMADWKAKVRQTLQRYECFRHDGRGTWTYCPISA